MSDVSLQKYKSIVDDIKFQKFGRVTQIVGLTIESAGPDVSIGSLCYIRKDQKSEPIKAEVVGFKNNNILLMPLGEMTGIGPGSIVESLDKTIEVNVSDDLLGRVLNGLGEPIDNLGELTNGVPFSVMNTPPDPLQRKRIDTVMPLGVKVLDSLLTMGKGQRIGIFAGSGVGKSTLLGMIARNTKADINVIALTGERGREIREFLEKDLGEEGLKRSVMVVATSDQPALIRLKAAEVATSVAEYFRDQGKDVLLMMDSLTRYSMAQREVGLAVGEPPVTRGYPPSVFAKLPKLLERAGNSDKGSISALYTVLVDGDDLNEPITDTARGILDGHLVLSRKIANKNQYPAIDVLASVSRVMSDIATKEHQDMANKIKRIMATYLDAEDLINVGAYVEGSNADIDIAIKLNKDILGFITQDTNAKFEFKETLKLMKDITSKI